MVKIILILKTWRSVDNVKPITCDKKLTTLPFPDWFHT